MRLESIKVIVYANWHPQTELPTKVCCALREKSASLMDGLDLE